MDEPHILQHPVAVNRLPDIVTGVCEADPPRATRLGFEVQVREVSTSGWLFPGLGCRYVGMGHDLFGRFDVADHLFAQAESVLGYDLAEVCLTGSGRKQVAPRQEAQVIYVLDCAYAAVLREQGHQPSVVAGHSLGSLAAGCACGAYDFLTGLELVTHVEELMEKLVDGRGLGMGVVIGLDMDAIQTQLSANPAVYLANWNSPFQHVLAGPVEDLNRVLAAAIAQGAKQARRFGFERAIHTPHVTEVAKRFQEKLAMIDWSEPLVPMAVGQDGKSASLLTTANQIECYLGEFLSLPVYWQATVETIGTQAGFDRQGQIGPMVCIGPVSSEEDACRSQNSFIEVGPGNVLGSMLPFIDCTAKIHTASEILEQKASL